jgi:hypothetical protein
MGARAVPRQALKLWKSFIIAPRVDSGYCEARVLGSRLIELAMACFRFICEVQELKVPNWRARLTNIKNCAYAWRHTFKPNFFFCLRSPAFDHVVRGGTFQDGAGGMRKFLGWSTERHWLLPDPPG